MSSERQHRLVKDFAFLKQEFEKDAALSPSRCQMIARQLKYRSLWGSRDNWFRGLSAATRSDGQCFSEPYPAEHLSLLLNEFEKSPFVSKERAVELAKLFGRNVKSVTSWFVRRRGEMFAKTGQRIVKSVVAERRAVLTKEFERNDHLQSERATKLAAITGLTAVGVAKWFHRERKATGRLTNNGKMTSQQEMVLKAALEECPYLAKVRKEALARQINVSPGRVAGWWIANRQIRLKSKPLVLSLEQKEELQEELASDKSKITAARSRSIGERLGLPPQYVMNWFNLQNRRKTKRTAELSKTL